MKIFRITLCLIIAVFLVSCNHKKEAKEVTQQFFSAIKNNNEEQMVKYYPEVRKLQYYMKSDTIVVKEIKALKDNMYSVSLTNKFTNGFGKSTETEITIYTKPKNAEKPNEGYVIYDSKGLCDLSGNAIYKFAKRKGYIKGESLTDLQVSKKVAEATTELLATAYRFKSYLESNVTVGDWSWESSDYSYSASGRGVIKNNTGYSIPKLKYIVTFTRNGNEVAQEDGYVTYDAIRPYGMESFSFFTSYCGNASRARVDLVFDEEFILETVANGNFE